MVEPKLKQNTWRDLNKVSFSRQGFYLKKKHAKLRRKQRKQDLDGNQPMGVRSVVEGVEVRFYCIVQNPP